MVSNFSPRISPAAGRIVSAACSLPAFNPDSISVARSWMYGFAMESASPYFVLIPSPTWTGRISRCSAVAYLKPHVLHRACGNNGGHLADAGLHDDLTQHLVRDNLLHGAGYFIANRLFHKVIHLLRRSIAQPGLYLHLLICNMAIGSQIEP